MDTTERASSASEQEPGSEPVVLPEGAPAGLDKAARGNAKTVTVEEEREAIRFLLGSAGKALEYTTDVTWDTEEGEKVIGWRFHSLPSATIERIENENRERPDDPFSQLKEPRSSAALVAESTVFPNVRSAEFRTPTEPTDRNPNMEPDADPVDALLRVFRFQSGLLQGIAGEIRRKSGFDPQRVGAARRTVTRAVGNSSS